MVQRIINILQREISGLHEAAFLLGAFALLSKVLALVRDRVLAGTFGAGAELDIYYAAFRIPDFIYVSLGTLVASAVLIPFIVERLDREQGAIHFINNIFTVFFISILGVSAFAFLVMPMVVQFVAPGLSAEALADMTLLSRIMLLSPILLGLSGLFASVTQSLRRFFVYALSPVLYNAGIIFGVVALYPVFGLSGLALGVVLGAALHLLIQLPVLVRAHYVPRFTKRIDFGEIRDVIALSLPRTLTLSAHHLVILVFVSFASLMAEGAITVFNFAFNLQSVPLSIIGISYSVAAFPTLARLFSNGDKAKFVEQVVSALRHIIFWSVPITALLIVLRAQVVRVILGTGEFGWAETRLTAAALALFAVSIAAQSAILLLVRGYYAAGHTRAPLFVNVLSSLAIIALGFALVKAFTASEFLRFFMESLLRVEGIPGTALIMLPLAFSIGTLGNVFILWALFKRRFAAKKDILGRAFRHSFYAAVIAGFIAHQSLRLLDDIFDINTFTGIFAQGFLAGMLGILAGVILLRALDNRELKEIERAIRHKFWKPTQSEKPVVPDQGEL